MDEMTMARKSFRRNRVAPHMDGGQEGNDGQAEREEQGLGYKAVSSGNRPQLEQHSQQDSSTLEQENAEGLTALGQAVVSQQLESVQRLVKMGANVNAKDALGRTCLAVAAYQGWQDGVLYLLRNGARHDVGDKSGRYPIHAATYDKDHRTLEAILERSSRADINQQDHEEMTALHWAAFHRRPEHMRVLLERGACVLLQDMDGKLPLHWAAQNGKVDCCRLLLKCPQDVRRQMLEARDQSGKTAAHFAAAAGHADIISLLVSGSSCHVDCRDPDGRSPLHWAAAMGHAQCVRVLIDLGVKTNVQDKDGETPLSYASQSGHSACVRLLERALNIPQHKRQTKKDGRTSSRKGKNPLAFLKGLFHSNSKADTMAMSSHSPSMSPDVRLPVAFGPGPKQTPSPYGSPSRGDGSGEKVSLPSISARESGKDPLSRETTNSAPTPCKDNVTLTTSRYTPENETRCEVPATGGKTNRSNATQVPLLPPLLNALPQREVTICTSGADDHCLGPLRGINLPCAKAQAKSPTDTLYEGKMLQKSATDFWSLPSAQFHPEGRVQDSIEAVQRTKKRGRRKSRRHIAILSEVSQPVVGGASDDLSESRAEDNMTETQRVTFPHSHSPDTPRVYRRPPLQSAMSSSSLLSSRTDGGGSLEDQPTPGYLSQARDGQLFVEAASVSLHSKNANNRRRLKTRNSDLRLLDL